MNEAKLYSPILHSLLSYATAFPSRIEDVQDMVRHICLTAEHTTLQENPNHVTELGNSDIVERDPRKEVNETGFALIFS